MIAVVAARHECLSILLAHGVDVNKADEVSTVSIDYFKRACHQLLIGFGWWCRIDVL